MKAKFVKSCASAHEFPKGGHDEIAFIGRSNAGKSSLLNFILEAKGLAKTSSTPGKTKLINFFEAEGKLFVDLPGWGFARASKAEREAWATLIDIYLSERKALKAVLLLLDIRRELSEEDKEMAAWLGGKGYKVIFVATKADKLNASELHAQSRKLADILGQEPIVTSVKTGFGKAHLHKALREAYARSL